MFSVRSSIQTKHSMNNLPVIYIENFHDEMNIAVWAGNILLERFVFLFCFLQIIQTKMKRQKEKDREKITSTKYNELTFSFIIKQYHN